MTTRLLVQKFIQAKYKEPAKLCMTAFCEGYPSVNNAQSVESRQLGADTASLLGYAP